MRRIVWLIILLLLAAAFVVTVRFPRSTPLSLSSKWTGHYRGLGITDDNSIFGYQYFRFEIDDAPYGRWEIENRGDEYNPVISYYPDGTVRMKGTCTLEGIGRDMYPLIDELDEATFFHPDETVVSTISDGTGMSVLCYPDGTPNWTSEYKDHERLWLKHWNPDGSLKSESR